MSSEDFFKYRCILTLHPIHTFPKKRTTLCICISMVWWEYLSAFIDQTVLWIKINPSSITGFTCSYKRFPNTYILVKCIYSVAFTVLRTYIKLPHLMFKFKLQNVLMLKENVKFLQVDCGMWMRTLSYGSTRPTLSNNSTFYSRSCSGEAVHLSK